MATLQAATTRYHHTESLGGILTTNTYLGLYLYLLTCILDDLQPPPAPTPTPKIHSEFKASAAAYGSIK